MTMIVEIIMKTFLFIQLIIQVVFATDYCEICENRTHTMCQYKEGPAAECQDYQEIHLTNQLKKYIVDIHNDIRNYVASGQETKGRLGAQPPSSDMAQLEWDEELAVIAQRWADQCIKINSTMQHDTCRRTERFELGQNVLTAITTDSALPELAILILNWYKQVIDVIPSDIQYFSGIRRGQTLIGQYTQLVWAKTKYVGCGLSIFREPQNKLYHQRLVCNYGPAGNVIGSPIYQIGVPCTGCPSKECDNLRRNLCRGNKNTTRDSSRMPFNLTLDNPVLKDMYDSVCRIISDEASQQATDDCPDSVINFSNRNTTGVPKEINHTLPLSNQTYVLGLMNKNSSVISYESLPIAKTLEKNYYNLLDSKKIINLMRNIKISENETELIEIPVLEEDCAKTFENIQDDSDHFYEFSEKKQLILNDEIVFPNKARFKRAKGKWQDGHCRCDRIYRSSCHMYKSCPNVLLLIIIFMSTLNILE